MSTHAIDLLKKLGSGIRPEGRATAPHSIDGPGFQDLLRRAQSGEISSNKEVTRALGAKADLDESDYARLAVVADAAEAAGVNRLVAVLDGTPVLLDVAERLVLGAGDSLRGNIMSDVDGVVFAPRAAPAELRAVLAGDRSSIDPPRAPQPRDAGPVRNDSLSTLLAALERDGEQDSHHAPDRGGATRAA